MLWRSLSAQASVWEFHMAGSESGGTQHKVQLSNDSFMQVSIVPVQSIYNLRVIYQAHDRPPLAKIQVANLGREPSPGQ